MAVHTQSCRECKKTIYRLLSKIYGEVEVNEQYDLNLPTQVDAYRNYSSFEVLKLIYESLQNYRGFHSFVDTGKLSRADYYLPAQRLLVEFDESQHFTEPRRISLSYYPEDLALGYDQHRWVELCQKLNRKDNLPPHRDEQRAWYDTLRDFSSVILGNQPTVRLYAGDRRWCLLDADKPEDVELFCNLYFKR